METLRYFGLLNMHLHLLCDLVRIAFPDQLRLIGSELNDLTEFCKVIIVVDPE